MIITSFDVGIKNLAYCVIDTEAHRIIKWNLLCVNDRNPCASLAKVLDNEALPPCDLVLIERQPGRNKSMLRMEAYIHMHCVARGLGSRVALYNAVHKLKDTGQENKGRDMYRARKKASVSLTQQYLLDHPQAPEIQALFTSCKKKDDLADSLLQALSYEDQTTDIPKGPLQKITPRKPTEKQAKSGRYSPSNIAYLVREKLKETLFAYIPSDPRDTHRRVIADDARLRKSVERHFGTIDEGIDALLVT